MLIKFTRASSRLPQPRLRLCFSLLATTLLMSAAEPAKLIVLGSGTPIPDPESSGPAVAIVVNNKAYLFDAGAGIVRRAEAAAEQHGIIALAAPYLSRLFITHLHTDHTLGYPDVIFTPWVGGRTEPLEVFGPKGTAAMTEHLKLAYSEDIRIRSEGFEGLDPGGPAIHVHEISPGEVYRDSNVIVTAIPVCHGSWPQAFGYSVNASGRIIIISGDTAPCPALTNACHEPDILLHEVYSADRFARLGPGGKRYHSTFHTSTREVADLANKCKPKLLVLYHQLYFGPKEGVDLEAEVKRSYAGKVLSGKDLGLY